MKNEKVKPSKGICSNRAIHHETWWLVIYVQENEVMAAVNEGGCGGDRVLKNLFEKVAYSVDQCRMPVTAVSWPWAHHR